MCLTLSVPLYLNLNAQTTCSHLTFIVANMLDFMMPQHGHIYMHRQKDKTAKWTSRAAQTHPRIKHYTPIHKSALSIVLVTEVFLLLNEYLLLPSLY